MYTLALTFMLVVMPLLTVAINRWAKRCCFYPGDSLSTDIILSYLWGPTYIMEFPRDSSQQRALATSLWAFVLYLLSARLLSTHLPNILTGFVTSTSGDIIVNGVTALLLATLWLVAVALMLLVTVTAMAVLGKIVDAALFHPLENHS